MRAAGPASPGASSPTPASSATRSADPTTQPTAVPTSRPTPRPTARPGGSTVRAARVIDGDTIVTTAGRIRLIGVDTPERGQCGYREAKRRLAALIGPGRMAILTAVPGRDDHDRYGRALRYIATGPARVDAGLSLILTGHGRARYDSRDGYGWHPRQAAYVTADATNPTTPGCTR